MGATTRRTRAVCGTRGGHRRHQYLGEPTCLACTEAQRAADAEYQQRPDRAAAQAVHNRARNRAETRLNHLYPAEYHGLHAAEVLSGSRWPWKRAIARLRAAHPDIWTALYQEEKARLLREQEQR